MITKFICARCKQPVKQGQAEGESGIYQSSHRLCEPCFFDEDSEIVDRGTNNLPDTLANYGPSNRN